MSVMLFYDHIKPYISNMTQVKASLICTYWREFWENPDKFKDTDLPKIISDWAEKESQNIVYDEWGGYRRIGR